MSDEGRNQEAGDRAAELNEQVAEGHEWAAGAKPGRNKDLHDDAASNHRRTAGKGRSKAEAARNEEQETG
ncbi:hypothetical protein [Mycobacterium asiaticum]|uniref:Uncharacterized protein n=1 Tax=Mycobacterium asiaticum TaxID=1790 RepID=A0A1A3KRR4_MYCAS|nr:hypothetical protein [Mycobacterium asiaticum]OBJ87129.1 hypothetical protein A5640_07540 [Mycobacterium asiaticum]